MSILERWYNGGIFPSEEIVPRDAAYFTMGRKISEERQYFMAKLPLEDKERFEKWDELLLDSSAMNCYANFSYGFKLGAMLMYELLTGDGGPKV